MALPTAVTPGYGFYPTYGPNPDVACDCLRAWLPVFQRLLELKGLGRIVVWNCTSALEASGGTHAGGGAVDWGGISRGRAMVAREMGAPATWPRDWTNNRHTHAVLSGCPHKTDAANYQVSACVIYRRDGLGWHGLAGPDPLPLPSKIRTWEQGIAWAKTEINRLLEEAMPTAADLWNYKIVSPNDPNYSTTAYSWLRSATVNASEAKKLADQAVSKVNALGTRQSLIEDVRDAVLNAPVPNHDPDPSDTTPPTLAAFRSYSVMANWRASELQGEVADVKADLSETRATLAAVLKAVGDLTAKVDALPKG